MTGSTAVGAAAMRAVGVSVEYGIERQRVGRRRHDVLRAVDDVSIDLPTGKTVGLVGESGSGKTTLGRALLRRVPIASGSIYLNGHDITDTQGEELRALRRAMQMVFQDPYGSLDPRRRVGQIIGEPLVVHGLARSYKDTRSTVEELAEATGLPPGSLSRYPGEFSGGQRQRINIARALVTRPKVVVLDEPVAALDTSTQAQVINLLCQLQEDLGLTFLLISHDLSVVRHVAHSIAVMYGGRLVETGDATTIWEDPRHPYTRALWSAVPVVATGGHERRERIVLTGEPPTQTGREIGCVFASRCPAFLPGVCDASRPPLEVVSSGHSAACHRLEDLAE